MTDNRANFKARITRDGTIVTLRLDCNDVYSAMWLFDKMLRDKTLTCTITEIVDSDSAPAQKP